MELVRGIHNLKARHRGCVLTIGNYDGLHLGHQAVLAQLNEAAAERGLPSALLTFEPMPLEFFDPEAAPPRLASFREKAEDAAGLGLDRLVCARFDRCFAAMTPEDFVRDLIVRDLRASYVLVGEDFRFGRERAGDIDLLTELGREHGFEMAPMPTVVEDGGRVSSTRVREALAAGEPGQAARLLGRPYRISGRVRLGAQLGRTLGIPTANLRVTRKPAPRFGVYAVEVAIDDGRVVPAAANLGVRPTVNGRDCLLEVHLLDFDGDLYGQRLSVRFRHFLRPEARFDSTEALRVQMLDDIERVRSLLTASTHPPEPKADVRFR